MSGPSLHLQREGLRASSLSEAESEAVSLTWQCWLREFIGPPGPGDFEKEFSDLDHAVSFVLDYYFDDPSLMCPPEWMQRLERVEAHRAALDERARVWERQDQPMLVRGLAFFLLNFLTRWVVRLWPGSFQRLGLPILTIAYPSHVRQLRRNGWRLSVGFAWLADPLSAPGQERMCGQVHFFREVRRPRPLTQEELE